jgi:hypothetical protein
VIRSETGSGMRRTLVCSAAALLAVAGLIVSAGPASADTTVTLRYPVTGSTNLAAPDATVPLGPGKLTATADLTTYTITAKLSLPDATGSFKEAGVVPVTATTQFINDGPTTGTVNSSTGAVATTSKITIRIVSLTVGGIPQLRQLVRDRHPGHDPGVEPAWLEHHQGRQPRGHLRDAAVPPLPAGYAADQPDAARPW